jgi:hypothetical protein
MKAQYFLVCLIGIFISNFSFSVESKKVFSAETYGEAFSLLQSSQISFAEDLKKGDQGLENSVYIYIPENESSERTLVICGGMGPEAGLLAWVKAIQIFPKRKIVLDQRCSIPDRSTAIEAGLESQKSKDLALHLSLSLEFASSFWSSESTVDVFVVIQLMPFCLWHLNI